ncbi:unnamed protein product [Rodentolepis nana]|uniref:Uncharacterized protein n=1 Tax=Rodentolepis nana TaxID=102285 RepID=A0A0R3T1K1_RODNA|nr:unnamed protein product [Rodentolepis nana]
MSLPLLLLVLSTSFLTIRADDDIDWSVGKICGIIFGGVSVGLVILACLACYRAWIRSKHDKMLSNFKDSTSRTQILGPPLPPPPPPQSESAFIYNPEYGPTFNTPDPFLIAPNSPNPIGINQISSYPPLSSYIKENPMIISQPYSCQAERTNVVMASEIAVEK